MTLYDPSPVQREFHLCAADEALLGGAGGPGKSLALLMDPIETQLVVEHARWKRGEIEESDGKAIHFRREFPMLAETIDRAHRIFPKVDPGAKWDGETRTYRFSCGYKYQFGHMRESRDWNIYDSNQFCVAAGTSVLMADGRFEVIEHIREGDEVTTLEGPRRVVGVAKPRRTFGVRLDSYWGHVRIGTQYQPSTHPVLTSDGGLCRLCLRSSQIAHRCSTEFPSWTDYESRLCGRRESPVRRASVIDAGICCEGSGDGLRAALRLPALTVPLVLHAPTVLRAASGCLSTELRFRGLPRQASRPTFQGEARLPSVSSAGATSLAVSPGLPAGAAWSAPSLLASGGVGSAPAWSRFAGSPGSCPSCPRCGDGRVPYRQGSGQEHAPSRACAGAPFRTHRPPDAEGSARGCSPLAPWSYANFYTRTQRPASEPFLLGSCRIAPAGYIEAHDIEVEHANHYITQAGVVNCNTHIGFDELWQFEEEQYQRLVRRCRTSDPVLMGLRRVRAATIPAGNWVRGYFVDPAPDGRVLLQRTLTLEDGTESRRTRCFIPARLKDNPDIAFRRDYEANLRDSPPHIRRALLDGDWYVVAGAFFAHEWRKDVHVIEPFKVPPGWFRFRSGDWGYKNPTVVLWWAADSDGSLLCYRERSWKGMDAAEIARAIKKVELEADEWDEGKDCSRLSGPMDTQIWERRGTIGPTIFETMSEMGVWWEKATKNRLQSTQQLLHRLKDRSAEFPGIRFFDTCRDTIRTIPAIGTSDKEPELPEDGGDDHWLDAVLYACMSRQGRVAEDESRPVWDAMDDELAAARRKHRRRGRYGYGAW